MNLVLVKTVEAAALEPQVPIKYDQHGQLFNKLPYSTLSMCVNSVPVYFTRVERQFSPHDHNLMTATSLPALSTSVLYQKVVNAIHVMTLTGSTDH